ncbi:PrgI family protein [Ohessyouella blattaphilus]|uniref:PrgI family protein n=1 Tax=Ohessyouella blattaphilus TaxID=2949333 RepID=A0ABT1EKH3_9FIRM|nr:PrgI family protein [Ohessyouella blattaphilus]MCP1110262.1 PrgI family protein [Ohessyouella blattaphilus]MCR8563656.1 PrgI family protein [Ohessyouella blattaphilus]
MNIKINKDFEREYQDTGFKGLTTRQSITLVAGIVFYGGSAFLLWYFTNLSPSICVYIVLPIGALVVAFGCYSYQGHNLLQLIKHYRHQLKTSILITDFGERERDYYRIHTVKRLPIKRKENKRRKRRRKH